MDDGPTSATDAAFPAATGAATNAATNGATQVATDAPSVAAAATAAPPPARRASPLARLACFAYLVLVIYASLTPWSGWRDVGVSAFAYLGAPWPERVTRFDVVANVLGYLPFGLLVALALYPAPRGALAVLIAVVAAVFVSGSIEALQTFLPRRVSSRVDFASNVAGALLGATLGAWRAHALIDRGRLLELRDAWFVREASLPLTLLALWPLAQVPAVAMLFTMGPADAALLDWLHGERIAWLPARGAWTPAEFIIAETVVTTCAVLAVGLAAAAVMQPRAPRARLLLALIGLALAAKTLVYGMRFGGDNALAWLTPGAFGGLVVGTLAAVVAAWGPPRAVARLAIVATLALLAAVSLVPENPYFSHWQAQWRTGRFTHFNALGEWVAFAWPFAAIAWLLALEFTRPRSRRHAAPRAGN